LDNLQHASHIDGSTREHSKNGEPSQQSNISGNEWLWNTWLQWPLPTIGNTSLCVSPLRSRHRPNSTTRNQEAVRARLNRRPRAGASRSHRALSIASNLIPDTFLDLASGDVYAPCYRHTPHKIKPIPTMLEISQFTRFESMEILRLTRPYAIIMKIVSNGMPSGCSGMMVGGPGTAGPRT